MIHLTPALESALVLIGALCLFAWGRVRHDLVALLALAACVALGLIAPGRAFSGFADPSVVVIAAVLIVGRAVELTGVADAVTDRLARVKAPFALQLAGLLVVGAGLSAFMNNIAALVITMPAVIGICRANNLPPSAGLMPLAFATILGGMTTLIGTPANLILSSVRQDQLGEPFGLFSMTPVAAAVAAAGVAYICLIGWRLVPHRAKAEDAEESVYAVFELGPLGEESDEAEITESIKAAKAAIVGVLRGNRVLDIQTARPLAARDRLLVASTRDPWEVSKKVGLSLSVQRSQEKDAATVVAVVGYGSPLVGRPLDTVRWETDGDLAILAAGRRAAAVREPLSHLRFEAGDQIIVHGSAETISVYARYARLIEVGRRPATNFDWRRAAIAIAIYTAAVVASASMGLPTAFTFAAAAAAVAALGFLPAKEIYSSIDWSVIVLIGAMIPVGQSFQTSGAAAIAAAELARLLGDAPLFWAAAAIATTTMVLSIFLNNVATAIIMGQIALSVSYAIGVSPDALLIAVLIGASSDFLTPIGHQNNLLVMGPGGYKFVDYARMGLPLAIIVILVAAKMIELRYAVPV